MGECNSFKAPNIFPNLNGHQHFRLNKINVVKDYVIAEIRKRELMSRSLSKYTSSSYLHQVVAFLLHHLQLLLEHL